MKSTQRLLHQIAELAVWPTSIPPISLNGQSNGVIELPASSVVTMQLYSPGDQSRELLFRLSNDPEAETTTPANMAGFLGHGGTDASRTPDGETLYWVWSLRNRTGEAVLGGERDAICITVEGY